ncbi:MAG: radical SAM protein [bacterium]
MKVLLTAINAKYIHTNLAIRLLKKNTTYNTDIIEFTIKDEIDNVVNYITENNYDIVGFSCYIWNITFIKEVCKKIKNINENTKIFLGGPEVSYNPFDYVNKYCDFVIKDEGEEAFDLLLKHLDNKLEIEEVPNLYYEDKFTFNKLVDLSKVKLAYDLCDDVENRLVYIETSRGCPYKCSYCMASLDNKVRFFDIDVIKEQVLILINRGTKVFKFLDRTFNANKKNFIELIDFIVDNHKEGNSFQFEITGDLLAPEIIEYINNRCPKGLIRFEIGIQSTNIKANRAVYRIQDNVKLFNNIILIQNANIIDLHLDLIAGLPYEDYDSFKNTFNEVVDLFPLELQLGFLKILHGTKLESEVSKYGYLFDEAPPYTIIKNDFLSEEDIKKIHQVEDVFEIYYNKGYFKTSIHKILKQEKDYYEFFYEFSEYLLNKNNNPLKDRFVNLIEFIKNKEYFNDVIIDIYIDYLSYFKLKPEPIWPKLDIKDRKQNVKNIVDKGFFDIDTLSRYSVIIPVNGQYVVSIYKPNKYQIKVL